LLPKVQSVMGLGTLVFRVGRSVSGTRKLENGTSVTTGDRGKKTLYLGTFPELTAIVSRLQQM
jgi:hypothetical protein